MTGCSNISYCTYLLRICSCTFDLHWKSFDHNLSNNMYRQLYRDDGIITYKFCLIWNDRIIAHKTYKWNWKDIKFDEIRIHNLFHLIFSTQTARVKSSAQTFRTTHTFKRPNYYLYKMARHEIKIKTYIDALIFGVKCSGKKKDMQTVNICYV